MWNIFLGKHEDERSSGQTVGEYITPHSQQVIQNKQQQQQPLPTTLNNQSNNNTASFQQPEEGVTSYLVASSPEVLSQLLKDNESRGIEFNPSLYTQPANAWNMKKVEFANNPTGGAQQQHRLSPLPPSPLPARLHHQHQQSMSMPPGGINSNYTSRSQPNSGQSTLSRSGSCGAGGGSSLEKRAASLRRKQSLQANCLLSGGSQVDNKMHLCKSTVVVVYSKRRRVSVHADL
jgi:hypothetical protein